MGKPDSFSKMGPIAGIIVFFIGVSLLAFTFYSGLTLLLYPERLAGFADLIPTPETSGDLVAAIVGMVAYLLPVLLIFALGYVASKIAAQGIQMYRISV
ncbi:MAG: hypothetical protein N3E47_04975 [Candidatus Bathyarchaeota archaeon]|nr:hypothetical protein [Candidatus Bathyarchaeota archaeon]